MSVEKSNENSYFCCHVSKQKIIKITGLNLANSLEKDKIYLTNLTVAKLKEIIRLYNSEASIGNEKYHINQTGLKTDLIDKVEKILYSRDKVGKVNSLKRKLPKTIILSTYHRSQQPPLKKVFV